MSDSIKIIDNAISQSRKLRDLYRDRLSDWLSTASLELAETFSHGKKIMIAGNGGSAGDSQHFAAELVVRLTSQFDRNALPAIALTVNSSVLTAAANDYGYENVFARQIAALGKAGDIFVGISTSGRSENILKAFTTCKEKSIRTFGLFGSKGPPNQTLCDLPLCVPSDSVMRIQEEHIFILHLLVELTEHHLFK